MKKYLVLVIALFALLLAACSPADTPTPVPPTVAPSATPRPTDTPVPPTDTPLPTATATKPPTLTPTLTPVPTATATPTPATQTSVVFTDTFGSTCNLTVVDDANHKMGCEGGEYTVQTKVASKTYYGFYRDARADGVFEVDVHMVAGNDSTEYGLVFHAPSDGSGAYLFTITPNGKYSLSLLKGSDWTDLIPYTDTPAIKQGMEKNHLKVIAQGDKLALYVNDQFLDTVSDASFTSGRVGVVAASRDPNGKFAFSNLSISKINWAINLPAGKERPPTPTPMPTLAPGTGGLLVVNFLGSELNYTIAGKLYKIPPNGQVLIVLGAGHYTFSLDAPGLKANCSGGCAIDFVAGQYITQPWRLQQ